MENCESIQGYNQNCVSSTPGTRVVYLGTLPTGYTQTNVTEILTFDGTDLNVVTALSGATSGIGIGLHKWDATKDTAKMDVEAVPDADGDVSSFKATLTLNMKKMSAESRNKIQLLASNSKLVFLLGDKNGVFHLAGTKEGGRVVTANGMTGLNNGERNGYEIVIEATESEYPYIVDDAAIPPAIID